MRSGMTMAKPRQIKNDNDSCLTFHVVPHQETLQRLVVECREVPGLGGTTISAIYPAGANILKLFYSATSLNVLEIG